MPGLRQRLEMLAAEKLSNRLPRINGLAEVCQTLEHTVTVWSVEHTVTVWSEALVEAATDTDQ